jgi:ACS family hexuronate transporter-like MFS transporter
MLSFLTGRYRWVIVALLFALSVVNYLDRQTLSVLAPTLRDIHRVSTATYSYIVTGFLVAYAIGFAVAGPLLDRFGVRRVVAVAVSLWSVAAIAHSLVSGWLGLLVCRMVLGFGESFAPVGGGKAVGEWVPQTERGLAMGIFSTGNVAGAVIAPPLVTLLLIRSGWRTAFAVTGSVAILWLVFWLIFYDSPEHQKRLGEPERNRILISRAKPGDRTSAVSVLKTSYGYGLFFARLLTDSVPFFFSFWLPEYLRHNRGVSVLVVGAVAWIPYLAADIGGISGGAFSDWLVRRGWLRTKARFRLLLVAACLTPLAAVAVRTSSVAVSLACISVVLAAHSIWIVNLFTLITETAPRGHGGTALGVSGVGGAIGGIIANLAAGRLIPSVGYVAVFTVLGFVHLAGFAVLRRTVPQSLQSSP